MPGPHGSIRAVSSATEDGAWGRLTPDPPEEGEGEGVFEGRTVTVSTAGAHQRNGVIVYQSEGHGAMTNSDGEDEELEDGEAFVEQARRAGAMDGTGPGSDPFARADEAGYTQGTRNVRGGRFARTEHAPTGGMGAGATSSSSSSSRPGQDGRPRSAPASAGLARPVLQMEEAWQDAMAAESRAAKWAGTAATPTDRTGMDALRSAGGSSGSRASRSPL